MAGNIVPRADGQANLGRADKEFDTIYAKNLGGTLADKIAMKDSPAFTGTPTAPTAAEGTQTTQVATTEFVQTANAGKADKTELSEMERLIKQYVSEALANYLPLSGGNLRGFIGAASNATNLAILGGTVEENDSPYLQLFNKNKTGGNAGAFELAARNEGRKVGLYGYPDGRLLWDNIRLGVVKKEANIGNLTLNSGGYLSLSNFIPVVENREFVFAIVSYFGGISSADAFSVQGVYLVGAANATITNVTLRCFYI